MRNMEQTANKAKDNIPGYYDLTSEEIIALLRKANSSVSEGRYDALRIAFDYGFVLGHRATLAGKVKKRL